MAWTTPKTWVDQETVSADDFNTQIRDNLDSIAGHTHTGAAGDGSAIFPSLDYIDLDGQSSLDEPAVGHTRFGSNTSGALVYRANGSTQRTVADTTHTHTIYGSNNLIDDSHGTKTVYTGAYAATHTEETRTFAPNNSTGTQKWVLVHSATAVFQFNNSSPSGYDYVYMRITKDGVQQSEVSVVEPSGYLNRRVLSTSQVYVTPAATSTVFELQTKRDQNTGSGTQTLGRTQFVRQVRCQ